MSADPIDHGTAGASARREHDRRRARREQATRKRHPHLGGLLLAVRDAPQHERAWATGAVGEELVAEALAQRCGASVVVLHDRRIPRSRANIDHLAIAPTGVWVVDAKRYKGKVAVEKPLFGAAALKVGRRDCTNLVDGVEKQVGLVRAVVGDDVPVHGALCFVEAELPLLGTPALRGVPMLGRKGLAKRLNARGPVGEDERALLVGALATAFPPA